MQQSNIKIADTPNTQNTTVHFPGLALYKNSYCEFQ